MCTLDEKVRLLKPGDWRYLSMQWGNLIRGNNSDVLAEVQAEL
jgi:hypothetical protein